MNLALHFYLLNDNFSPEYAQANHDGEESENNPLYDWEDELFIGDLMAVDLKRDSSFNLEGFLPDDQPFSHEVKQMFTIELTSDSGQKAHLGVSESILDHFDWQEEGDQATLKVYIKAHEPHGNHAPGIYIASKEFPKELVF